MDLRSKALTVEVLAQLLEADEMRQVTFLTVWQAPLAATHGGE